MGLDSVELAMEFEKYFGIDFPDGELEKAITVQNVVDMVARHLNISNQSTTLRDRIFNQVNVALFDLGLTASPILIDDQIFKYLDPEDQVMWKTFYTLLQKDIPKPAMPGSDANNVIRRVRYFLGWEPTYDWRLVTVDQFVKVICARNHEELIDRAQLQSTYEIYIIISALAAETQGLDYYEIGPTKSFANDLGIS